MHQTDTHTPGTVSLEVMVAVSQRPNPVFFSCSFLCSRPCFLYYNVCNLSVFFCIYFLVSCSKVSQIFEIAFLQVDGDCP